MTTSLTLKGVAMKAWATSAAPKVPSLFPVKPKSKNKASAEGVGDEIPILLAEAADFPATSLTTIRARTTPGPFLVVTHLQVMVQNWTLGLSYASSVLQFPRQYRYPQLS